MKPTRKTFVGEVLSVRILCLTTGKHIVVKEEVSSVSDDGLTFGVVGRLLKQDGTWSTPDDFANTDYGLKYVNIAEKTP